MSDISNNNSSLHHSNDIFELWGELIQGNTIPVEDSDEEMIDADSIVTIQSINARISNWSNQYTYIPLFNNYVVPDNTDAPNMNAPNMDAVNRAANGLISRSFVEDGPKYKNVLSEKGKSIIKFVKYNSEKFSKQSMCPITQEEFEKDQLVAQLPCGHIFEKESVMKWLENQNASCPNCRSKLDSVEEEIKKEPRLTMTNLLNYIGRREQRREEEDVQRAIMASLRDIGGNTF